LPHYFWSGTLAPLAGGSHAQRPQIVTLLLHFLQPFSQRLLMAVFPEQNTFRTEKNDADLHKILIPFGCSF